MAQLLASLIGVILVVLAFKAVVIRAASRHAMTEWAAMWASLVFVFLYVASSAWLTIALLPWFSDGLIACAVSGALFVAIITLTSAVANRFGLRAPVTALTH